MKNESGSVLLEALLATVILSVSITIIIQSLTSSLRAAQYSSQYTEGLILIDDQLTEYFQEGVVESDLNENGNLAAPYEKYQYKASTEPAEEFGENINILDYQLNWQSGRRKNNIKVQTLLFKKDDETAIQ
ncbi:MAG: hypothetical protein H6755_03280 [Candidatus Omnitrophica bacterium]|nr:hypothetical protein [Candidatus Omnitrophota bacterium]MCB9747409.1 hypothetical protein [Candidatus Omnitrophota bacterium]